MKKLDLGAKLRKAGIRSYNVLIHDQPKHWLIENFKQGATKYPVNVSRLMRNIIWQTKERIQNKEKEPLRELIRTFWYMYIKPTLTRVNAFSKDTDQYTQLIDNLVTMVKKLELMRYKDIGFRDDNQAHRRVGTNANIILFSEKLGHQNFLDEIAKLYNVSIIALGGQPSVLNIEYFVDDLKKAKVNLRKSFYLFSIVDYNTSGWIIRDAFVKDLKFYGIPNIKVTDLVHPDMLTKEEIKLAKCFVSEVSITIKDEKWLKQTAKKYYKNQHLLEKIKYGKKLLYGFESESVSSKRLKERLEKEMVPLLGKTENLLQLLELKKLDRTLQNLIVNKVKWGEI